MPRHTALPRTAAAALPLLRLPLQEVGPQLGQTLARQRRGRAQRLRRQGLAARRDVRRARAALVAGAEVFDAEAVEGGRQAGRGRGPGRGLGVGETGLLAFVVGPAEQGGDQLQDLEFFRVGSVEGEEVEEVVGYDLAGMCVRARRGC